MTCYAENCEDCAAESDFWREMQVIHDFALAEVQAISAAAARNRWRRIRRGWHCGEGILSVPKHRSRMNPNRTTWGKGR